MDKIEDATKYDALKLENQLCFPLYACSREIIKQYKPYLDEIDLTYTQYIAMMVLWEKKAVTVKELGNALFLDSGTLTQRSAEDERSLIVSLTEEGEALKEQALAVPYKMAQCSCLEPEEAAQLYQLLYKMLR